MPIPFNNVYRTQDEAVVLARKSGVDGARKVGLPTWEELANAVQLLDIQEVTRRLSLRSPVEDPAA